MEGYINCDGVYCASNLICDAKPGRVMIYIKAASVSCGLFAVTQHMRDLLVFHWPPEQPSRQDEDCGEIEKHQQIREMIVQQYTAIDEDQG